MFERGYDSFRDRLRKNNTYSRSCFNCAYYGVDDQNAIEGSSLNTNEECQNLDVTEYDVIVDGNRVYCTQWKQLDSNETFFKKKTGRNVIL